MSAVIWYDFIACSLQRKWGKTNKKKLKGDQRLQKRLKINRRVIANIQEKYFDEGIWMGDVWDS